MVRLWRNGQEVCVCVCVLLGGVNRGKVLHRALKQISSSLARVPGGDPLNGVAAFVYTAPRAARRHVWQPLLRSILSFITDTDSHFVWTPAVQLK